MRERERLWSKWKGGECAGEEDLESQEVVGFWR
jgi:hypothetical protein